MDMNLKDKLGFVYSFNMIFIFAAIFCAIILDGFVFGLASAILITFIFAGGGAWLIYRLHLCQETIA